MARKIKTKADLINREYRDGDIRRWQSMDFIVGYEIHRSNNPSKDCDICSKLAGKQPLSNHWNLGKTIEH
jgi:hypothetical protein